MYKCKDYVYMFLREFCKYLQHVLAVYCDKINLSVTRIGHSDFIMDMGLRVQ